MRSKSGWQFIGIIIVALVVVLLAVRITSDSMPVETDTTAQSTTPQAGLTVDAGIVIAQISPYAFGANLGPFAIPIGLFDEAEHSGITFLRFPHGRWGDENNLSHFNIDLFIRMARLIGAEPSIAVRLDHGTPEAAAELVRYTNIEKEYGVRYWYIGNEPNLYAGYRDESYTTEDHNREWRAIAEAMLTVDPDIKLIGPGISQWNGTPQIDPRDSDGRDWLREFLLANGDLVDIVSVHRYPFPLSQANPRTTIDDLRNNVAEWSNTLPNLRAVIAETTGRDDLKIAVTEFNSHWSANVGGEATNDSHYNAIWTADVLGRMLEHEPFTLAYFDYYTADGRGGWGLLADFDVRPTYYTYQMYQHFGNQMVAANSTVDNLSVYASTHEDGALTVIVVNLADEAVTTTLSIDNFAGATSPEAWLFDPEHKVEPMTDTIVGASGELMFPAQSITLLEYPSAITQSIPLN
ncbi:MAG: hypothetical protein CUN54_01725 [Phototrophicales bacterium]|nr:MAG: hypothetical protein CUN54_01725 [Phototrophicales bacterium]